MRLYEIDTKYIKLLDGVVSLLENYTDPHKELSIIFNKRTEDAGTIFYEGIVSEIKTQEPVIYIDFYLMPGQPKSIFVDNVRPSFSKIDPNKTVHTTLGPQHSGVDMGHSAMKWVFGKIKEFALSTGFTIKKIQSSNRYTGARAKNNLSSNGEIDSFDINTNVREYYIYDCNTDILEHIIK